MAITAKEVKSLREKTGAGMMDCKKALTETEGDFDTAVKWLREKGMAVAAKRSDRTASEGAVSSYIHMGGKIGVLVEVNCETDFVARSEPFLAFCKDLCLQVCSAAPRWVRREEVPGSVIDSEKEIYVTQARDTGKPEKILEKIAVGKLNKFYEEFCLLNQKFVKDGDKTITDLVHELTAQVGEKIDVRRFVRFECGEGIGSMEPESAD